MSATVERSALLRSLSHVHRVVERRNTIPILSNVLISAEGGRLTLKATDLDLEVTETVAGRGRPGRRHHRAGAHPARHRAQASRRRGDRLDDPATAPCCRSAPGRSRFTLQVLPESDFPDLTTGEFPTRFALAAARLKKLIDRTQFAISTEETRYYLNGIYLHVGDGDGKPMLRAVATDGHRLAQVELPRRPAPRACRASSCRARRSARSRSWSRRRRRVEIELSDTKIRVTIGDVVLTSKLIDGTFPDYARVIPPGNDKVLEVDRRSSRPRSIASRPSRRSAAAR